MSSLIVPLCIVAVQLYTFTAEGTATAKLRNEKTVLASWLWPLTNMWWPHTRKVMEARPMLA